MHIIPVCSLTLLFLVDTLILSGNQLSEVYTKDASQVIFSGEESHQWGNYFTTIGKLKSTIKKLFSYSW